jgi:hypothetical protein
MGIQRSIIILLVEICYLLEAYDWSLSSQIDCPPWNAVGWKPEYRRG